jgi:hypothetical protein
LGLIRKKSANKPYGLCRSVRADSAGLDREAAPATVDPSVWCEETEEPTANRGSSHRPLRPGTASKVEGILEGGRRRQRSTIRIVPPPTKQQLNVGETQALIAVRALLAESSHRVADRTTSGRHVAVVLLDSAVEAAIAVCLGRFGDSATERDALADMHKRLSNSVKGTLPGWREVSQLRKARNLAHHHQIPVDSEVLQSFFAPVSDYIESAVRSTFDVRLSDVVLADSLDDPRAKELLARAERALEVGDVASGVAAVFDAFRDYADRTQHLITGTVFPSRDELGIGQKIETAVKPVRDTTLALLFSHDPAEYLWFDRLRSSGRFNGETSATTDDLRRALQFVVGWVQRAEAYARTHRELSEREQAHSKMRVAASSRADGRPEWETRPEVTVTLPYVEVKGRLRWGKGDDHDGQTWHSAVARAFLAQPWSTVAPGLDSSPTVWRNEVGLRWKTGDGEPSEIAEQAGAIVALMTSAFTASVQEFDSLREITKREEQEATNRILRAASLLALVLQRVYGAELFDSADTSAGSGDTVLTFAADVQGVARRMFRENVSLPIGNLYGTGLGVGWLVPSTATDAAVLVSAEQIRDLFEQATIRQEVEALRADEALTAARATIEELWRD